MPIPREAIDAQNEVTATLSGEEDIDPIIQRQVEDDRAGRRRRDLPEEFLQRVFSAQEYAMRHQGLEEDECCRRRGYVNEWLDSLRWGDRYDDWCNKIARHVLRERREWTPEERAAEEAREAARKAEREAAGRRAEVLLRDALSPKQLKELNRRGYFHVVVGDRRFRITRGRSHNIKEVDARGRILRTLCAHPVEQVPDADTMLAQKLWLESLPEEFIKIANVVRVQRRRRMPAGVGQPVVNTRDIDRLVMDRVAEQVARAAEEQARREWQAAEEDMRILEDAAVATTVGVEPAQPETLVPEPAPVPEGQVRAA
jgi:hypothetical protein